MSKLLTDREDMNNLWIEYRNSKDAGIREKLVEHYLFLVNIIAGRVAISLPAHVDREDLISCGFFGLLDAIEKFDAVRGNKFETYAGIRIRGAMLDSLREKDWLPGSVRQKIKRYEQTVSKMEFELGRPVEDKEVAEAMGLSDAELSGLLNQMNIATTIPLEDYMKCEQVDSSSDNISHDIEQQEIKECLAKAIDKLPEKEKIVVSLYYYEELTLKEISLILHLTEARISQLHTKAVFRMRGALARYKSSLI